MSNVPIETTTTGESKQESFHLGPEEVLETEITTKITDAQTSEPADVTVDAASTASSTVETKSEPIPPILTPPKQPAEVVVNRTTEVSSPSGKDSSVSFGNAKQRNDGEESDANSLAETKPMEEAIGTEEGTIQDGLKVNALSANNEENVVQREVDQVTKTVNNALERIQEAQLNESMQVQQEIFELGARQNAQTVQLNGILQSVVNIAQVLTSLQESQKKLEENEMQSSGNIVRSNDKDLEASGNQDRAEAQSRDLETSTHGSSYNRFTGLLGENYENDEGGFPETKERDGNNVRKWKRTGSERSEERLKEQVRYTLRKEKEQKELLQAMEQEELLKEKEEEELLQETINSTTNGRDIRTTGKVTTVTTSTNKSETLHLIGNGTKGTTVVVQAPAEVVRLLAHEKMIEKGERFCLTEASSNVGPRGLALSGQYIIKLWEIEFDLQLSRGLISFRHLKGALTNLVQMKTQEDMSNMRLAKLLLKQFLVDNKSRTIEHGSDIMSKKNAFGKHIHTWMDKLDDTIWVEQKERESQDSKVGATGKEFKTLCDLMEHHKNRGQLCDASEEDPGNVYEVTRFLNQIITKVRIIKMIAIEEAELVAKKKGRKFTVEDRIKAEASGETYANHAVDVYKQLLDTQAANKLVFGLGALKPGQLDPLCTDADGNNLPALRQLENINDFLRKKEDRIYEQASSQRKSGRATGQQATIAAIQPNVWASPPVTRQQQHVGNDSFADHVNAFTTGNESALLNAIGLVDPSQMEIYFNIGAPTGCGGSSIRDAIPELGLHNANEHTIRDVFNDQTRMEVYEATRHHYNLVQPSSSSTQLHPLKTDGSINWNSTVSLPEFLKSLPKKQLGNVSYPGWIEKPVFNTFTAAMKDALQNEKERIQLARNKSHPTKFTAGNVNSAIRSLPRGQRSRRPFGGGRRGGRRNWGNPNREPIVNPRNRTQTNPDRVMNGTTWTWDANAGPKDQKTGIGLGAYKKKA